MSITVRKCCTELDVVKRLRVSFRPNVLLLNSNTRDTQPSPDGLKGQRNEHYRRAIGNPSIPYYYS